MNSMTREPGRRWRTAAITAVAATAIAVPLLGLVASSASGQTMRLACERGAFCLWTDVNYAGQLHTVDLRTGNPGECIVLPTGFVARSLANRSDRDLTVFSDPSCAKGTQYVIYPGGGTFVPKAPFDVAAIQIGE